MRYWTTACKNDDYHWGSGWIHIQTWNALEWEELPERLLQQHPSIPLETLLKMWKDFKLVLLEKVNLKGGKIGRQYNVYSEEPYEDYGRHLGLLVITDKEDRVISHEVFNIRG